MAKDALKLKVLAVECVCGEQMRNVGDGTSFCDNPKCEMYDVRVTVGEMEVTKVNVKPQSKKTKKDEEK